jgi:hypothetical protein
MLLQIGDRGRREQCAAGPARSRRRIDCRRSSISRPRSSRRSRNGGSVTRITESRLVEVGAEPLRVDLCEQVAIGRGDQSNVGVSRLMIAEPPEFSAIEEPQQLGLHLERELADLVDEQRAAGGDLECAEAWSRWRR